MATVDELHVGDVGTVLRLSIKDGRVALDCSTATLMRLIVVRKDRTTFTENLSFLTDGVDGKLVYTTKAGDLTVKGDYKIQVYLEFGANHWHTNEAVIPVAENIAQGIVMLNPI